MNDLNVAMESMPPLLRAAIEAAAFVVQRGHRSPDGTAVTLILSYLRTTKGFSEAEIVAAAGKAFDIFAEAQRRSVAN